MLSRRSFLKRGATGLAVAGVGTMIPFELGCPSFGNIVTDIGKYIPIGLAAFSAIINILSGAGILGPIGPVIQGVIILVKAGFADLQAAIVEYNNAPAAQKQTLLGKISTIIADITDNLNKFWSDLNIPDAGLASLVEGLLQIILSTLGAFANQLPTPVVNAKRQAPMKMISAPPVMRSAKKFKADFNAKLAGTPYAKYAI